MDQVTQILLWNSRGLRSKKEELANVIRNHNYNIIGITEIKAKDSEKIQGFDSLLCEGKARKITAGGVAMFVRKNTRYDMLQIKGNDPKNIDIIGIRTKSTNKEVSICVIYRRPGTTKRVKTWKKIVKGNKGTGL